MDSGLARFAVLILLFFVMTGDLAGIVRQLYDETSGYGSSKQQQQQQQQQQQAPVKRNGASVMMSDKGSMTASASAPAQASTAAEGEGDGADPDIEAFGKTYSARMKLINTIKESCLPKLICELTASANRDSLTESERYLLSLIRETTISTTAEVTSKYHFAAHMGQLINGIDNTGCHNFYPGCPFPGLQVMHMMKKVKIL